MINHALKVLKNTFLILILFSVIICIYVGLYIGIKKLINYIRSRNDRQKK